jgi:biotin transport system permease protein/energy-coupling factor transport system permease protein
VLSIIILNSGAITGAMLSVFLIALIPTSGLAPRHILKALKPMVIFFVLLFLLHLIFTDGIPIPPFPLWRITITYEGLYRGGLIIWQFSLLILSASILTMTTSPTELVIGIERLLRPFNILHIPSHDVAIMISIALRFVPTFLEEIARIKEAQMARGANFKTGTMVRRIRAIIALLIPLIISSLRRADELAIAMEGRAYKRGPRTYLRELRMSPADYAAVTVMILITGFYILQDYTFLGIYSRFFS